MKKIIRLTESQLTDIIKNVIKEQSVNFSNSSSLDLQTILKIFKNKGFSIKRDSAYKILGHKETTGPVQNKKTGEFYWNYEFYVPLKPSKKEGVMGDQLWIGKRRESKVPIQNSNNTESENIIIGLSGPNHQVVVVKNGKIVSKNTMATDAVISMLQNYRSDFI